ncbi:hypothetical protein ATANTOWER_006315 [Ataeniobius toweri]|uniref:Uncharacterized protein n=1 Tax=Ataeniobius toweri TaxID=208326 RepID=A0ABU7C5Z9_9TELE|nr:hypothetical protein [Ataeniobius toweri]
MISTANENILESNVRSSVSIPEAWSKLDHQLDNDPKQQEIYNRMAEKGSGCWPSQSSDLNLIEKPWWDKHLENTMNGTEVKIKPTLPQKTFSAQLRQQNHGSVQAAVSTRLLLPLYFVSFRIFFK